METVGLGRWWKKTGINPARDSHALLPNSEYVLLPKEIAFASPRLQGEELTGSSLEGGHQRNRKSF